MVGLLDWELWSQAGHVAFACQALVAVRMSPDGAGNFIAK